MVNETELLQLPDYSIEYTPTQIQIHNLEGLQRAVNAYANRYANVIVTDDTEKSAKDSRAKLNKLSNALDEKRRDIHRDYNKPYDEFADTIKQLRSVLQDTIDPIDDGLKELDGQHREQRKQHVQSLITEMSPNYGVSASDVEIDPKWLNKSTSKKAVTEGIAGVMKQVKQAQDKFESDSHALTKYAEVNKVDATPWIDQLKQGQELDYLFKAIDHQVDLNNQKQKKLEAQAAEAKAHQKIKGDAIVDTDTGEVVSHQFVLKITGTNEQLWALRHYMDQQSIKYEKVGD
ncbi:DUF1351 domain-containing protein [Lactobacillus sp. LC28-10]|uniref:DUF1351 domain-containing protein n=1 Tax=Secundilactobacillus angelensis TaxID=2722706 RepID=A0ABX1L362_9LACO|nr:DUF1351 domain-containing protein [Secundilactobacillus angelensis]MCH5463512.1 DUF1351 domain-containing protein [Secundilactobacillus angelensis]NLR19638.1 DUF1351 domain-containing protein [Secundilactobacillus angelensis]